MKISEYFLNMTNKAIKNTKSDGLVEKKKDGNVKKKDYVLNDLEALKKKMANEKRSPEIGLTGEAVDGSCSTVGMKTSLFEYFKAVMMNEIGKDERITSINAVTNSLMGVYQINLQTIPFTELIN